MQTVGSILRPFHTIGDLPYSLVRKVPVLNKILKYTSPGNALMQYFNKAYDKEDKKQGLRQYYASGGGARPAPTRTLPKSAPRPVTYG